MKRKFALFNLTLMAVVLFTTAFQSFHAFSHKHTHSHVQNKEIKKFGVQHHADNDDDCSICHFHFDFFIAPEQFCLRLDFPFKAIPYSFNSIEGSPAFKGSLFALRAPPALV
ncbi:hypothetical protein [Flavobacterium rhizosphaerae]|uniref:DUF2946 domain-containing protein n=1 Tax=Flavobacterium rhizosphaerae TaxID=3163298 RepID=A0ABW8YZV8_9FLAO